MENQIMENPIHRSVLLDHKLMVDGVTFHEYKEINNVWTEGVKETQLSHFRTIGDSSYAVKQSMVEGEIKEENIDTTMSPDELENFKNEWTQKWLPSISEQPSGLLSSFFNKLDSFLN